MSVMEMLNRMNELEKGLNEYESRNKNSLLRESIAAGDPDSLHGVCDKLVYSSSK